jgi:hypothetical protein
MLTRRRDARDVDERIGESLISAMGRGTGIQTVALGEPHERMAWALEHRHYLWPDLKLDFEHHAFLRDLYEDEHPHIVLDKASQMGASEWAITDAFWAGDARGANVLYLLPGVGDVTDFSTARVGLAIEASPYIASIITPDIGSRADGYRTAARDRATLKRVRNRFFYLRHGSVRADGRAPHLKTAQIDLVIYDEYDEIDPRAPALADKRQNDSLLKWTRWISTPTLPDWGIDRKLAESDYRQWFVTCQKCGTEQALDPFKNLILEADAAGRPRKWFHKRGHPESVFLGCNKCGKPLDREAPGTWIATNPGAEAHGYHLNRLMSPRTDLHALVKKGQTYDETERKEWFNQDLGMPYQPEGSGFTESLIRSSYRGYRMPIGDYRCMMGVDVGAVLHVVIRKFIEGGRQAVFVGTVDKFEQLDDLVERYDVKMTVVDALPETRSATKWVKAHPGRAKIAFYATGAAGTKYSEETREKVGDEYVVDLDRTRHFDGLRADFLSGEVVNPAGLEGLEPDYIRHFGRVTRVMETDKTGGHYARWVRSGDDHFVHSEIYCRAAMEISGPPMVGETTTFLGGGEETNGREETIEIPGERGSWEPEDGDGRRKSAWR